MQFMATLHPLCALSRDWRSRHLPHVTFRGIRFDRHGVVYSSGPLTTEQVATVKDLDFVTVEMLSNPPAETPTEPPVLSDDELLGMLAPAPPKSGKKSGK